MNIKESGSVVKGKVRKADRLKKDEKALLVEAVLLELGRYVSCGATYQEREKAYPRLLFEKRIVEVIDKSYGA